LRVPRCSVAHGDPERQADGVSKDGLELFDIQVADRRELKPFMGGE
jgi:hypothetical protein